MRRPLLILSLVFMSNPLLAEGLYDLRWSKYANARLPVLYACIEADQIPAQYHDRAQFDGLLEGKVGFFRGSPRPGDLGGLLMGMWRGWWFVLIGEECLPTFLSVFGSQARRMGYSDADLVITKVD